MPGAALAARLDGDDRALNTVKRNIPKELQNRFRERVALDLADRSLPGMVAYTAIWSVIVFTTGYHQVHPPLAYGALAGFVFCGLLRLIYQLIHKPLIRNHLRVNNILLIIGVFLPTLIWSGLFAFFFLTPADSEMRLLVVIATVGLCSGGSTSYAPVRQISAAYAGVLILPTCMGIAVFNPNAEVFLYLLVLYIAFNLLMMQRGHREYWTALANEAALEEKTRQLEIMSETDALTGVYNRRFFDRMLDKEWQRGSRDGCTLTLLILDIDHFKRINDTYGHLAGDEYLRHIAALLKTWFKRCSDVIARYGGEEFAILAPGTPAADVAQLAQRLRNQIETLVVSYSGRQLQTTASMGIAGMQPDYRQTSKSLIRRADEALYQAKHDGRNQVCTHPPLRRRA